MPVEESDASSGNDKQKYMKPLLLKHGVIAGQRSSQFQSKMSSLSWSLPLLVVLTICIASTLAKVSTVKV